MQKTKSKCKNDEPKNPALRLIRKCIRGFINDIHNYRLIYFMPLVMGVMILIIPAMLIEQRLAYAKSEEVLYPLIFVQTLFWAIQFFVYCLSGIVWLGILFLKARTLFVLMIILFPIIASLWLGSFFIPPLMATMSKDSIQVNNYRYHVVTFVNATISESERGKYRDYSITVYKCDSASIVCDTVYINDINYYYADLERDYQFEIQDNQLLLTRHDNNSINKIAVIEDNLDTTTR